MMPSGASRGWSLLETLVAVVVLGMGVLMYMRMQGRASGMARMNSDLVKAGQILEQHVEGLRVRISRDPVGNWPPKDTSYFDPDLDRFTVDRRVKQVRSPKDGAMLSGVRQLDITVAWGRRALDTLRVTTYVSKNF